MGGKHGLSPEQVVESQRERMLEAMRHLLCERGYQAVRVGDVTARAGVSRKTFYELYPGKEDCLVAVYDRAFDALVAPALDAFEGDGEWGDRLRAAVGALLDALAADPGAARICFVEILAAGPKALARRNEAMARLDRLFDGAETDAGTVERPAAVAAGRVGDLAEVLHRAIAAGKTAELPDLSGELMYTFVLPFLGQAAAERELTRRGDAAPEPAADRKRFLAAYDDAAEDLLRRVAIAIDEAGAPAAAVRAAIEAMLEFCAEEPDRARLAIVDVLAAGRAARARREVTMRRLAELVEEPLRELRPTPRLAQVAARALVGGVHELVYDPVDRGDTADLPALAPELVAAQVAPAVPV